MSQNTK